MKPENRCQGVQNQTNKEWLGSYDNATKYRQASNTPVTFSQKSSEPPPAKETLTGDFQCVGYRTTKQGRVVLDYVHKDTGEIASRFFNVNVHSARTGKMYRVGEGGQFTTKKGHRFRRFWLYFIGEPPFRWSRVHTEMHKLKAVSVTGTAVKIHTKNSSYWNLKELRKK